MNLRSSSQTVVSLMLWLVTLSLLAACGREGPETAPVDGIVRLDGKPLTSGVVTFLPEAGRSATGEIQSDGTFELGTYSTDDGALVGVHKVTVSAAAKAPTGPPNFDIDKPRQSALQSPIPVRYANPDGSGLEFEVQPGITNHFEIDLVSK